VRRASKEWRLQDKLLISGTLVDQSTHWLQDLDDYADCFVLVDKVTVFDPTKPSSSISDEDKLPRELVRNLASSLASLALKIANSFKFPWGLMFGSTLSNASDLVQTNTPVLCLDLRERPKFEPALDRVELIEHAKTKLTEFWDALQSEGLADC
jgi:hypothetical protein